MITTRTAQNWHETPRTVTEHKSLLMNPRTTVNRFSTKATKTYNGKQISLINGADNYKFIYRTSSQNHMHKNQPKMV